MAKATELRSEHRGGPEYDSVPVTPEVAATWLRLNRSNRPLRKATIERFVRMMNAGTFRADHPDHIIFDEEGYLLNGQHRLHAIVRSQKQQQMRVLRHVPREIAHEIDIGTRRTVEDSVWIARGDNVDRVGLKLLTRFASGGLGRIPYTRQELIAMYDRYGEALSEVAHLFIEHKQGSTRACIRAAVVRAWVARTKEHARLRDFVETLCTGHYKNAEEDSAALVLRDHLLVAGAKGAMPEGPIYRKVNHAIGKFLAKEKVTKVAEAKGEQFRIPEDAAYEEVRR